MTYIGMAQQSPDDSVKVYDEMGRPLFIVPGKLVGFTSRTVTAKNGCTNFVYNEKGMVISTTMDI